MKTTTQIQTDGDILDGEAKWFSVSDVEQLQKELKEEINYGYMDKDLTNCEICKHMTKAYWYKSEKFNKKRICVNCLLDEVFNNFKGK